MLSTANSLARAHKADLVVGYLVGQHERAKHMPHADGGPACHHKDHMPPLQKVLANPPVLIALNFNGPVIEKVGHDLAASQGMTVALFQQGHAQNNERPAFDHHGFFAVFASAFVQQIFFKPFALHVPDALAHAFDRHKAVGVRIAVTLPGVFHVNPGQQGARGPQDHAVLVVARKLGE